MEQSNERTDGRRNERTENMKKTREISGWVHNFWVLWQYARWTTHQIKRANGTELPCTKFKAISCCNKEKTTALKNGKIFSRNSKNMKTWKKKRCNFFGGLWFWSPFLNSCLNCCYPVICNHLNAIHLPRAKYSGMLHTFTTISWNLKISNKKITSSP